VANRSATSVKLTAKVHVLTVSSYKYVQMSRLSTACITTQIITWHNVDLLVSLIVVVY